MKAKHVFEDGLNVSFEEFCIWCALWGMFGITRDRLFKVGTLLTKQQFMATGFGVMLPPATLLRLARADWPYAVQTQGPGSLIAHARTATEKTARDMMGLG